MTSFKHIASFTALAFVLATGIAMAETKLVYDGEGSDKAPRSGLKSNFKPASKEVEAARKKTNLPKMLQFNRLHVPEAAPNLHPTKDGLHDATLESVQNQILPPTDGLKGITKDALVTGSTGSRDLKKVKSPRSRK